MESVSIDVNPSSCATAYSQKIVGIELPQQAGPYFLLIYDQQHSENCASKILALKSL